jgi:hypothetical protein
MNILILLVIAAVAVGGLLAYRWVRAQRAGHAQAGTPSEPPWRQSQIEPDSQAGRI